MSSLPQEDQTCGQKLFIVTQCICSSILKLKYFLINVFVILIPVFKAFIHFFRKLSIISLHLKYVFFFIIKSSNNYVKGLQPSSTSSWW